MDFIIYIMPTVSIALGKEQDGRHLPILFHDAYISHFSSVMECNVEYVRFARKLLIQALNRPRSAWFQQDG